ncbi:hypothetical protein L6452_31217 [Arctium lappa]|uniref:Uncharacterized protein n=1 Tax=Arctium lappa TaxID=4217 RepID=A0ACB8ZKA8_ARCLA|nr:hypothetical protein L6452_31217 [Arctium lappa]
MMEMAEAADVATEVMMMEDANELKKKVRKLHQGIALKKSGNIVFYIGELQLYPVEQLMRGSEKHVSHSDWISPTTPLSFPLKDSPSSPYKCTPKSIPFPRTNLNLQSLIPFSRLLLRNFQDANLC